MSGKFKKVLPEAMLLILCFAAYSNSFQVPFQFDDDRLIRFNFSLRDPAQWKQILQSERFRPLTTASFAVNFQLSGKDPVSYHIVNLLLHAIVVLLFRRFLLRRSSNVRFAWFAAALFAVHPLLTESVTYISSRSILLCAAFGLMSLLAFDSYVSSSGIEAGGLEARATAKRAGAPGYFVCLILAAFSKEEAAMIPVAAALYELVFAGMESVRRHRHIHIAGFLLLICGLVFRITTELEVAGQTPHEIAIYWTTQCTVWIRYLGLALFPVSLNIDHAVTPASMAHPLFWVAVAMIGVLLIGAVSCYRRQHLIPAFWGAWFFLFLLPSFAFPLNDFMAEHRVYLSMMGFCAIMAYPLIWVRQERPVILIAALSCLVLFYAGATFQRNKIWSSRLNLWLDAAEKSPDKFRPHINLGYAWFEMGDMESALREYGIAQKLNPLVPRAYTGAGFCRLSLNDLPAAHNEFRKALALNPGETDALTGLGIVHFRQGDCVQALSLFERTLDLRRESVTLIAMTASCYIETGQLPKAATVLERSADPSLLQAARLLQQGKHEGARAILLSRIKVE